MKEKNSRLVYSTDGGRVREEKTPAAIATSDGIVRLRLETKGRKGKGVTLVIGLALPEADLKALAKRLKQVCGSGGSVKEQVIEIQGDHRSLLKSHLEASGHRVKLAGG